MQINLVELDLASLEQLGGGAAFEQVRRLIEEAVDDMNRRPGDKGKRTIKINLVFEPITRVEQLDEQNFRTVLDGVSLSIEMDFTRPKRKALGYDLGLAAGGRLVFNPDSPHNHRQQVFPQVATVIDGDARDLVPLRQA